MCSEFCNTSSFTQTLRDSCNRLMALPLASVQTVLRKKYLITYYDAVGII